MLVCQLCRDLSVKRSVLESDCDPVYARRPVVKEVLEIAFDVTE